MWLLLSIIGVAQAQDVVLPPYTPSTTSDFGLADELTEATRQAFVDAGLEYAGPLDTRRRVGPPAEACWDTKECVPLLFERFPEARVIAVGAVGWDEGTIQAKVRFYGFGDPSPIEVVIRPVEPDAMGTFSTEMASLARDLLPLLPPRAGGTEEIVDGGGDPPPDEDPPREDDPREDDPPPKEDPAPTEASEEVLAQERAAEERRLEAERRRLGLPKGAYQRYRDSGLDYKDWASEARVRSRKGVLEVWGGMAFGDVNRRFDTRVWVEQDERGGLDTVDTYEYETFVQGRAPETTVTLGYMPAWWLEVGVNLGVQFGTKQLTTGWEQTIAGSSEIVDQDARIYDPASATLAVVTPRFRGFFMPTGPVKPFVLAGATFRMHDGYSVPDLALIDYPDRPGGLTYGPTVGGGIAFDFPGAASLLVEVPWTKLLSDPYSLSDTGLVQNIPEQLVGSGQVLEARAGLGIRF